MTQKKILFVCLGNICRSPMAEGVMKQLVFNAGKSKDYYIDSAGTSAYHSGAMPDSRMRLHASKRGYQLQHRSRQVIAEDFEIFDLIIGMDTQNINRLRDIAENDEQRSKIRRMTDYCRTLSSSEVPDPYYGGDAGFQHVINLLEDACNGLYEDLEK